MPLYRSARPRPPTSAITRIYAHAVRTARRRSSWSRRRGRDGAGAHAARRRLSYIVAEIDERWRLRLCRSLSAAAGLPFSVEDSIYIDPAAQRRGVSRALLDHLIENASAGASAR